MVANGFKRKNVPVEYLKARKDAKKSNVTVPEPDDLNWSFVYNNSQLRRITKTKNITNFCKMQHLEYIAHVTRLDNGSFQKQLLFSCQHKKYSCDRWPKIEKDLGVCKIKIQKTMQNKKEFMSLLHHTFS